MNNIYTKPEFLFHASSNKDIEVFEPKNESIRDETEGPVVFGTPFKDYASCFIVHLNDSWSMIAKWTDYDDQVAPWNVIISDKQRFFDMDKGGAIYTLPSETFYLDLNISKSNKEWVSKSSVKPISKEVYKSGLEAMLALGVNVYFTDKETLDKLNENPDNGPEILKDLEKYINN